LFQEIRGEWASAADNAAFNNTVETLDQLAPVGDLAS
jgi:hypothetical protein